MLRDLTGRRDEGLPALEHMGRAGTVVFATALGVRWWQPTLFFVR
jgi:hypothetical protein